MKTGFVKASLLGSLLLLNSVVALAQGQPAREQLERFAQGLITLQAGFEQRVLTSEGRVEDESSGNLWLQQPNLFRWEYGGDFPESVIADGRQIWIHDEVLEQVTVKPQTDYAADSPLSLLTDIGKLDEQFEVREAGDMDEMALLELRSRNAESEFERVLLGLQNNQLVFMTMEDMFGLRTEIRFANLQRNRPLSADLFSFTPPPGVDVIGADASGMPEP